MEKQASADSKTQHGKETDIAVIVHEPFRVIPIAKSKELMKQYPKEQFRNAAKKS